MYLNFSGTFFLCFHFLFNSMLWCPAEELAPPCVQSQVLTRAGYEKH